VKLSDVLVLDARLTGKIAERSIAGQIEYWANLGRALEPLLQGDKALALCNMARVRPLSECIDTVDSPKGRSRLEKYLEALPYPHYELAPDKPGFLLRIDESGKRTCGRFINRRFVTLGAKKK